MPPIQQCADKFHAVNGSDLPVYGRAIIDFKLGEVSYKHSFIIADMPAFHGLLGLDFLGRSIVDVDSGLLWLKIHDEFRSFDCIRIVDNGVRLVCTQKKVIVYPGREVLIAVQNTSVFKGSSDESKSDLLVIEPFPALTQQFGCFAAAAVIESKGNAFVSIANLGNKSVIIPKGTSVGFAFPLDTVHTSEKNSSPVFLVRDCDTSFPDDEVTEDYVNNVQQQNITNTNTEDGIPDHLKPLLDSVKIELNAEDYARAVKSIVSYADVFAAPGEPLGRTKLVEHTINTQGHPPVRDKMRRYPQKQIEIMNTEVDRMLEQDVIEPSMSPYHSPVVVVKKKDGSARMCLDVRRLNKVTKKDAYTLPRIRNVLESLNGANYFCVVDLQSGYWQLPLAPEDREKTAFSIPFRGHFQFKVMPFGLCNAPASFERLMEHVMAGLQWDRCLVYLDDIVVAGKTVDETITNFEKVLARLQAAGLKLKPSKCTLFARSVRYLGHIVSSEGISCDPEKIVSVKEWPRPRNVSDVRSFCGLAGYYREHIDSFSKIAEPLFRLTRKAVRFKWSDDCQLAFEKLKEALTSAPVLAYPDPDKDYILDTDASQFGMGGVLSQLHDGHERVVAYASKTFNKAQRNYCTTRRELLAVITFVKHFRHYLYGTRFTIRTDHASLRWLTNFKDPEGILARWITTLETYNYVIEHRPGKDHSNADSLSRTISRTCPREDCNDCLEKLKNKTVSPTQTSAEVFAISAANESLVAPPVDISELLTLSVMSWDELAESQQSDPEIGPIYKWKVEGATRPPARVLEGYDSAVRCLWGQWDVLVLEQGVLCRNFLGNPNKIVKQVVLPCELRKVYMSQLHDAPLGGHRGIKKTFESLQGRVFWPGHRHDVKRWVQTCPVCQSRKSGNQRRRHPLQQRLPGYPLERVAMDIIGPIRPPTSRGNSYILVIEDYFSKYIEAFAIKDHTAQTVADIYVTEFVSRYGVGKELHTDQGPEFESWLFKEIMKLLGIKKTRTAPYRPQSDGVVERVNQSIKNMLSAYVDKNYENWDEYLPYVLLAYRSTLHESTGCTPNLLFHNRECNLPLDFFFEPPPQTEVGPCPLKYVEWVKQASRQTNQFVRERLKGSLVRQKRNYDRTAVESSFVVGDLVYREYLPQAREHKFSYPWKGPYKVMDRVGDVNYRIQLLEGGKQIVVHVDHLKKCLVREESAVEEVNVSSHDLSSSDASSTVENDLPDDVAPLASPIAADVAPAASPIDDDNIVSTTTEPPLPVVKTRLGRVVRPRKILDL